MDPKQEKNVPTTKILSVRLPMEEAKQVDAMAKSAGLNRNDYIRLCLGENAVFADARGFDALIEVLRNLERLQEAHLERLDGVLQMLEDAETINKIQGQIEQGERLMEDLFKAQRKAVRILDGIRAKVG